MTFRLPFAAYALQCFVYCFVWFGFAVFSLLRIPSSCVGFPPRLSCCLLAAATLFSCRLLVCVGEFIGSGLLRFDFGHSTLFARWVRSFRLSASFECRYLRLHLLLRDCYVTGAVRRRCFGRRRVVVSSVTCWYFCFEVAAASSLWP